VEKVAFADVLDLVRYEQAREGMRAAVIALKKDRRIALGDTLTLLFENRETVLFQIQEMVRTERLVTKDQIQGELDAYNALIPGKDELSATLFIEIPGLVHMGQDEVHRTINRFQGLDEDRIALVFGDGVRASARFEGGHSKEEKMAAVQYLRFALPAGAREALADPERLVKLRAEHPSYRAEAVLPAGLRAQLLADLS
jgi:hypothetical protein